MMSILRKATKLGIGFAALATFGLTMANVIYWHSSGIGLGEGISWPTYFAGALLYYLLPLTVLGTAIGCVVISSSRPISRRKSATQL